MFDLPRSIRRGVAWAPDELRTRNGQLQDWRARGETRIPDLAGVEAPAIVGRSVPRLSRFVAARFVKTCHSRTALGARGLETYPLPLLCDVPRQQSGAM